MSEIVSMTISTPASVSMTITTPEAPRVEFLDSTEDEGDDNA